MFITLLSTLLPLLYFLFLHPPLPLPPHLPLHILLPDPLEINFKWHENVHCSLDVCPLHLKCNVDSEKERYVLFSCVLLPFHSHFAIIVLPDVFSCKIFLRSKQVAFIASTQMPSFLWKSVCSGFFESSLSLL